jgi:CP family cyanate transporter-like MFS transporter
MTAPAPRPLVRGRILALAGIVLVALTLRTAVGAVSPIIGTIETEIPLGALLLATIGAAPSLVFGLSGLLAPVVSRRWGLEGALIAAMAVQLVGHLMRALAPHSSLLLAGTVLALLGAGVGNVLLPPVVKRYFPDRIGLVTAIYVTALSIGATVPPVVAVPIADAAGWRISLGVWALVALIAAVPWVVQLLRSGRHVEKFDTEARGIEAAQAGIERRLFRSPIAWSMALMFGLPSMHAYAMFAWMPSLTADLSHVDAAQAGVLLGVFAFCGIPSALLAPILATRLPSVRPLIVASLVFFVGGYAGFLLAPTAAPLLWAVLVGMGPILFPLALTLINLRTRTHAGSVALSGFVQGIGYVIGAIGPLVVGLTHDASGGWVVPIWFLLGTLVLTVPGLVVLGRRRFVEDEVGPQAVGR